MHNDIQYLLAYVSIWLTYRYGEFRLFIYFVCLVFLLSLWLLLLLLSLLSLLLSSAFRDVSRTPAASQI